LLDTQPNQLMYIKGDRLYGYPHFGDRILKLDLITKPWQRYVLREHDCVDPRAYTFCVLDGLRKALRRRDVFISLSWRYADPRAGLLAGTAPESAHPIICRSIGLPVEPVPALVALTIELDQIYRAVAARLPNNPAVRFETEDDKKELVLSPFDKLDEPESLVARREAIVARLPVVDQPEILLVLPNKTCCGGIKLVEAASGRTWPNQDRQTTLKSYL
jgi:hypothetical protein